jgi:hypothetical protein
MKKCFLFIAQISSQLGQEIATLVANVLLMRKRLKGGVEVAETTLKMTSMLQVSVHW